MSPNWECGPKGATSGLWPFPITVERCGFTLDKVDACELCGVYHVSNESLCASVITCVVSVIEWKVDECYYSGTEQAHE